MDRSYDNRHSRALRIALLLLVALLLISIVLATLTGCNAEKSIRLKISKKNSQRSKYQKYKQEAYAKGDIVMVEHWQDLIDLTNEEINSLKKPMEAPTNLSISGNTLSWEAAPDVSSYTVEYSYDFDEEETASVSGTSMVLPFHNGGDYDVTIKSNPNDPEWQRASEDCVIHYTPKYYTVTVVVPGERDYVERIDVMHPKKYGEIGEFSKDVMFESFSKDAGYTDKVDLTANVDKDIKLYAEYVNVRIKDGVLLSVINLEEFIVPDYVTTIDINAFKGTDIKKIFIPSTVTTIKGTIYEVKRHVDIFCEAKSKPQGWASNWVDTEYSASITDSKGIPYHRVYWDAVDEIEQDGLRYIVKSNGTDVDANGFVDKGKENHRIPSEVTLDGKKYNVAGIPEYAFYYDNIAEMYIPNTVTQVGKKAFKLSKSTVIYAGVLAKPEGWDQLWCGTAGYGDSNVKWNCSGYFDDDTYSYYINGDNKTLSIVKVIGDLKDKVVHILSSVTHDGKEYVVSGVKEGVFLSTNAARLYVPATIVNAGKNAFSIISREVFTEHKTQPSGWADNAYSGAMRWNAKDTVTYNDVEYIINADSATARAYKMTKTPKDEFLVLESKLSYDDKEYVVNEVMNTIAISKSLRGIYIPSTIITLFEYMFNGSNIYCVLYGGNTTMPELSSGPVRQIILGIDEIACVNGLRYGLNADDNTATFISIDDKTIRELYVGGNIEYNTREYVVDKIISYAEYKNTALFSVGIMNTVKTVGSYAFSGINGKIYAAPKVKPVGWDISDCTWNTLGEFVDGTYKYLIDGEESIAFAGLNTNISGDTLTVPATAKYKGKTVHVKKMADKSLYNNTSGIKKLIVSEGIEVIGEDITDFYHINSLQLPSTIKKIGNSAFESNYLTEVKLPAGIEEIGTHAFRFNNINVLDIPSSIVKIGKEIAECVQFIHTTKTSDMVDDGIKVWNAGTNYIANNGRGYTLIDDVMYELSNGVANIYRAKNYKYKLTDLHLVGTITRNGSTYHMTKFDPYLFAESKNMLKTIKMDEGIIDFDMNNFNGHQELTSVSIPGSMKTISNMAFDNCPKLSNVTLNNGVEVIDRNSFFGCKSLTHIDLPASIKTIVSGAFSENTIKTVNIFDLASWCAASVNYDSLGRNMTMLLNGEVLTDVVIPSGVTTINSYTFSNIDSIKSVVIPRSVTTIAPSAFRYSKNIAKVEIPNSVTKIDSYVFEGCDALTIYAEVASEPEGWHKDTSTGPYQLNNAWNPDNRPVKWSQVMSV